MGREAIKTGKKRRVAHRFSQIGTD